jgi:hypothetical protein
MCCSFLFFFFGSVHHAPVARLVVVGPALQPGAALAMHLPGCRDAIEFGKALNVCCISSAQALHAPAGPAHLNCASPHVPAALPLVFLFRLGLPQAITASTFEPSMETADNVITLRATDVHIERVDFANNNLVTVALSDLETLFGRVASLESALTTTQSTLVSTQSNAVSTQSTLTSTRSTLVVTQSNLVSTQGRLGQVSDSLGGNVTQINNQLSALSSTSGSTLVRVSTLEAQSSSQAGSISSQSQLISTLQAQTASLSGRVATTEAFGPRLTAAESGITTLQATTQSLTSSVCVCVCVCVYVRLFACR